MQKRSPQLGLVLLFSGMMLQAGAQMEEQEASLPKMNMVKVNIPGLFARSYSIQYERVLNRKFSAAVSYRRVPNTGLPFKRTVLDIIAEDAEAVNTFKDVRVGGTAITPEIRLYLSRKGYGRGFYLAPFYRYTTFTGSGVRVNYELPNNTTETVLLSGKSTANSAGLMMGAQWSLGKNICLDWWILGAHYGSAKAEMNGRTSRPLNQQEQDALRQELEELDIPIVTEKISVDANGARIKMDGPWSGVRAGLSLGVKF